MFQPELRAQASGPRANRGGSSGDDGGRGAHLPCKTPNTIPS